MNEQTITAFRNELEKTSSLYPVTIEKIIPTLMRKMTKSTAKKKVTEAHEKYVAEPDQIEKTFPKKLTNEYIKMVKKQKKFFPEV
jgi:hypothetical protein